MEPRAYDETAEAEMTHWWFRELRRIWSVLLAAAHPPGGPALRILDAGCGTGGNLRFVEEGDAFRAGIAFGVDLSARALAHAARQTRAPLVRASVTALPFRAGSFDAVLCTDVLYHADVRDEGAALGEMRRVLRERGSLVVNVPAFESLRSAHDRAMHTARRYRRSRVRALLEASGFEVVRILYWNGILFLPAVLFRFATRRRTSGSDLARSGALTNGLLSVVARVDAKLALLRLFPAGTSIAALARRSAP